MASSKKSRGQRWPRPIAFLGGIVILLGILGVGFWALSLALAGEYGATAEGSLAHEIASVGPVDAEADPERLGGWNEEGELVWEGSQAEFDALTEEGQAQLRSDLLSSRLYPSAVAIVIGGLLLAIGVVGWRAVANGRHWYEV